ncbi:MAG: propionyl-CoA carboxylase alpha chain [Frankiales bacterium]|nr:propionyl-CoA carboxylase alpha chain [Frankiales bacterium]
MIEKVLVANRGEIARRVFRTCHDMGIATVAVYSEPDSDAPFVREADEAVPLGGATPAESYLRADRVLEAAIRSGADAVHPGYGFLSEDATFAAAVVDAGLTWIGPPPEVVRRMGSKLEARSLMAAAGVPVLPGQDLTGLDDDEVLAAAETVGWPVLVKASAGGGGRGMRVVRAPEDLLQAAASARREAASAFGDDTVFLERYVEAPRHVEIQVFGDTHGQLVALHERECSLQRRHQKVLEEAPSPVVDPDLRQRMSAAAVTAATTLGYVGAGTVEFVLAPTGEFFFLEVNTRLQVEHPVTELVTGLDLVRLQLLVADGHPLPPEALSAPLVGHAIEVRLYAEDPARGFIPTGGRVRRFSVPQQAGVRVDSGIMDGDIVSPNYDPMLAKVIAYGANRDEAILRLRRALRHAAVDGIVTNLPLLLAVLDEPDFRAGDLDTHWFDRHPPTDLLQASRDEDERAMCALAAALAAQAQARTSASVLPGLPSGWRNNPAQLLRRDYADDDGTVEVGYQLGRAARFQIDGVDRDVTVHSATPDGVVLVADGLRRRFSVIADDGEVTVAGSRGSVTLRELPRFPTHTAELAHGSLVAPMPGTVVRTLVTAGDAVTAGTCLVVLEAMKMEHQVVVPVDGVVVELSVQAGQTVSAGDLLVVVQEPAEEAAVSAR